ncbi:MAG: HIT family protein [Flavobacteriales bacterium]|nr:MAG: HIT family protein [Flavobacteriales bacterium]MBE7441319.1 HIT family protein [Flavobacteriales bacterium]MBX2958457.1 HIT family protein [Flavobacteriales bacterium]MCL4856315.1 HIT family protein [Flavobacteriales bacterium]HRN42285.1 HIT family protein [Vicingus sp.]
MESIFSKIIKREIPAYIIDETDDFIAFLDVFPLAKGHVLVVPKKQVDYIFDLEPHLYSGLWIFANKIAHQVEQAIPCKRIGIAVIGLEVPHAHIHLLPLQTVEDINFSRPKLKLSNEEMQEIAFKIKNI